MNAAPHGVVSVGAVVRRGDSLLVVRPTYGPTKGRYMFPGGLVDPDEQPWRAAEREAREESGVTARTLGVLGLRTRAEQGRSHADIIWLLEHVSGEPSPQSEECDDARYLPLDALAARDDVEELVTTIVARLRAGAVTLHHPIGDNTDASPADHESETWRLYL